MVYRLMDKNGPGNLRQGSSVRVQELVNRWEISGKD